MSDFKIVVLEEADDLSVNSQAALRTVSEEYTEHVRFIFTCNYERKIMPAIKSRCWTFRFKSPPKELIIDQLLNILESEGVTEYSDKDLLDYVDRDYPDIRLIVNNVSKGVRGNTLVPLSDSQSTNSEYIQQILDAIATGNWQNARKIACENVAPEEWESVYRLLYENIETVPKLKKNVASWEQAIVIIAEHPYQNSIVADPEINAAAMFIRLGSIGE